MRDEIADVVNPGAVPGPSRAFPAPAPAGAPGSPADPAPPALPQALRPAQRPSVGRAGLLAGQPETRVLVAYASRHGATAGIAEAIGDMLRRAGLAADVRPAQDVRDLGPYAAVVLGSSLYYDRWQKEAVEFLRRHKRSLRDCRLWLFSSGPIDRSAEESDLPMTGPVTEATAGVSVREHRTFGGKLTSDTPGFVSGLVVRGGFEGDFRNFDRIRAWAREIATALGLGDSASV